MPPRSILILVLCVSAAACEPGDDGAATGRPAPAVPAGEALYALSDAEREVLFRQLAGAATAAEGTPQAIAAARDAARVARAIVRLGGSARYVGRARAMLERATAAEARGACEGLLALARFEAEVGGDPVAAQAVARRVVVRFASDPASAACVEEARGISQWLGGLGRPGDGQAAAAVEAPGGEVVNDDAIADFARGRAQDAAATLEQIAVYGADPEGEMPLSDREVRVVLRFDDVAVYRRGQLPAGGGLPRRVFLDLDQANVGPDVQSTVVVNAGGLARVRTFPLDRGRTRVSFDVDELTAYRLFFLSDPFRVVMDFRDQGRERERAAAGPRTTIVLDPGHGGEQPGAKGPEGLKESTVALSLARRVRKALQRQLPSVRVLLTRDEDRFLTLEERTAIANGVHADLFVSIHLNASDSPDDKGGVSTFVLDTTSDDAALRLAARENGTDEAGVTRLQFILASLYREDQVGKSLTLANAVHRATLRGGRRVLPTLNDRGVKRALFYVLVGARMPAVLVEASFITRPEEATALHTDEYRDALSEGIAEGIARYVDRGAE
ncbi:MAG: N-acetylmuramoyl-L-alanine amidase [Myxococcales bacterium]|jgi:N-acetylmuramoyl-L-alanine amidase